MASTEATGGVVDGQRKVGSQRLAEVHCTPDDFERRAHGGNSGRGTLVRFLFRRGACAPPAPCRKRRPHAASDPGDSTSHVATAYILTAASNVLVHRAQTLAS